MQIGYEIMSTKSKQWRQEKYIDFPSYRFFESIYNLV